MEEQLIELQTQLAFQEQTINDLSDVLANQQKLIDMLQLEIKLLNEKLEEVEDSAAGASRDEKPPHY